MRTLVTKSMNNKTITIEGLETKATQYGVKFVLKFGKEKYEFYDKKKTGHPTKAYEQFKARKLTVGDTVVVAVDEQPKSFTNKEGKNVNYTQRRVMYFPEPSAPAPAKPPVKADGRPDYPF